MDKKNGTLEDIITGGFDKFCNGLREGDPQDTVNDICTQLEELRDICTDFVKDIKEVFE